MGEEEYRCPPYFTYKLTGLAIREYLNYVGEGYPYEFYICFKRVKPSTSYESVRRYFYILKRLGLIEPVRREPSSKGGFPRTYYRIVVYDDPRWIAPQEAIYPETRLGKRRYEHYVESRRLAEEPYAPQVDEIRQYINFNSIPSYLLPYVYHMLDDLARTGECYEDVVAIAKKIFETGNLQDAPIIREVLDVVDSIMGSNYADMFDELMQSPSLDYLIKHSAEIVAKYRR